MGRMGWRHLLVLMLVGVLTVGFILPVYANSLDDYYDDLDNIRDRLDETKDERNQTKSELDKLRDELDTLDREMNLADKRLRELEGEIRVQEVEIAQQEQLIADVQASIAETEEYLKVQTEFLEQRLRAMYKNGTVSYLEVLFSSATFVDFLSRFGILRTMIESDTELVAKIEAAKVSLEADKAVLDFELDLLVQRLEELDSARATAEQQQQKLAEQAAKYKSLSARVAAELRDIDRDIAEMVAAEKFLAEQIKKLMELERIKAGDPPAFLTWPVPGFDRVPPASYHNITSGYGNRIHPITGRRQFHPAIDIARLDRNGNSIGGKPIVAAAGGTVEFVRGHDAGGYGIYVIISHGGGVQTLYAHMRNVPLVTEGQVVTMGQQIGVVGTTGSSTGNHLHFEVWVNGKHVNPLTSFEYR